MGAPVPPFVERALEMLSFRTSFMLMLILYSNLRFASRLAYGAARINVHMLSQQVKTDVMNAWI